MTLIYNAARRDSRRPVGLRDRADVLGVCPACLLAYLLCSDWLTAVPAPLYLPHLIQRHFIRSMLALFNIGTPRWYQRSHCSCGLFQSQAENAMPQRCISPQCMACDAGRILQQSRGESAGVGAGTSPALRRRCQVRGPEEQYAGDVLRDRRLPAHRKRTAWALSSPHPSSLCFKCDEKSVRHVRPP